MSTEVLDRAKVLATGADVRGKTAVEAAILTYRNAVAEWEHDDPISGSGKDAERRQCDAYIALLAAISDATAAATEAFKRGMRRVFKCSAHEVDPTKAWGCPDCLAELRRATAARGTVGGQAGPVGDVADADPATRGPLPKGGLPATQRCSKCRGVPSHTPGGIPCDECGLIGSMPWGG